MPFCQTIRNNCFMTPVGWLIEFIAPEFLWEMILKDYPESPLVGDAAQRLKQWAKPD